jgi:general secretion pathway protein B
MSYILDALRRADSERDRGSVPGLHAQQVPASSAGALREGRSAAPWLAATAALLLVAVLAWRLLDRAAPGSPPAAAPAAPTVVAPAPATAVAVPAAATTAPMTAAATPTVAAPVPTDTAATAVVTAAAVTNTNPAPPRALRRAAPVIERTLPAGDDRTRQAVAARVPAASAATTSKGLVYNRAELPADLQRQLPNLEIGGATFSRDSASRMLIINGQIFHEGDVLAPDLALDEIQLKAAVFRFKGYRYRITF